MSAYAQALETDRRLLWSLCYRMTGNAADADDLVQETFVRAIENPPRRADEPLRPWLVRVAINLSRDLLRRRRRQGYVGPWLPSPVPTDEESPASYEPPAPGEDSPVARYELLESVSFAFLLALEALTPSQRAVLLLRDVFDYSVRDTADALGMSEPNVKTTHHRARRTMAAYDHRRCIPTRARHAHTREALERFLIALSGRDSAAMEALLSSDVRHLSDGGEYAAAHRPVIGRDRVMRLLFGLNRHIGPGAAARVHVLNGLPALLIDSPARHPRVAPRGV